MPKVVSEEERQRVLHTMREKAISLIKKKGLKKVTVEDVCIAVNIGKGSFYTYYDSKEAFFYEILRISEQSLFERIMTPQKDELPSKEKACALFREIYLAPDSIALYISPDDIDWLLRKLPSEYYDREKAKSANYFELAVSTLKIDSGKADMNVLSGLMAAITYIATDKDRYGENAKEKILDILIAAMGDYLFP